MLRSFVSRLAGRSPPAAASLSSASSSSLSFTSTTTTTTATTMQRAFFRAQQQQQQQLLPSSYALSLLLRRWQSSSPGLAAANNTIDDNNYTHAIDPEDMPYLHHGTRPRFRDRKKFKNPRKRAAGLMHEIGLAAVEKSRKAKPAVFGTKFAVGDAIEVETILQGGINETKYHVLRGVVIGIFNKGIDSAVLIRDVVHKTPVERKIPLHSPLVKSLTVLEKDFVYKGRRRVKRAKLYFLRERPEAQFKVTGVIKKPIVLTKKQMKEKKKREREKGKKKQKK